MSNKKYCNSFKDMLTFLNEEFSLTIDVEASSFYHDFLRVKIDNGENDSTMLGGRYIGTFFKELHRLGVPINLTESRKDGVGYTLVFADKYSVTNNKPKEAAKTATQQVNLDEVKAPLTIEQTLQKPSEEDTDTDNPPTSYKEIIETAEALYDETDKSGSKVKLEEYGRSLGVELNRGRKFENMISDLRDALLASE